MQLKRMSTSILSNGTLKMSKCCVVSLGIRNKVMHGNLIQASLYIHTYVCTFLNPYQLGQTGMWLFIF